jgi:hypothetical protein
MWIISFTNLYNYQRDKLAFVIGADPETDRAVAQMKDYSYGFIFNKIAGIKHDWAHVAELSHKAPGSNGSTTIGTIHA